MQCYNETISIIVPVYRTEKYLHTCLNSILAQTYEHIEVILVDDGSPDKCPEICDEYALKDSRVKVIHQKNSGVAIARNRGLDIATGTYVTFVDSDDYIEPVMYEKMVAVAKKYDSDVVLCDCVKEFQNRTELYSHNIRGGFYNKKQLQKEYYPQLLITTDLEYPATISNWLCLFKNSIRKSGNLCYEEDIRISEDWLFGAKLMINVNSFYYMKNEAYYHYRMNEESVTHSFVSDKWNDYCKLYEYMKKEFSNIGEYDFNKQIDKVLLFLVYNAVGDYLRTKQLNLIEKVLKINWILNDEKVKYMFERLNIWKLQIPIKQKIQTICYKNIFLIKILAKYYERR